MTFCLNSSQTGITQGTGFCCWKDDLNNRQFTQCPFTVEAESEKAHQKKKKKEREKEKQLETKPFVFREQCERLSKETNVPFTVPA